MVFQSPLVVSLCGSIRLRRSTVPPVEISKSTGGDFGAVINTFRRYGALGVGKNKGYQQADHQQGRNPNGLYPWPPDRRPQCRSKIGGSCVSAAPGSFAIAFKQIRSKATGMVALIVRGGVSCPARIAFRKSTVSLAGRASGR